MIFAYSENGFQTRPLVVTSAKYESITLVGSQIKTWITQRLTLSEWSCPLKQAQSKLWGSQIADKKIWLLSLELVSLSVAN